MKLPFTIHGSRFAIWKKSPASTVAARRSAIAVNRQSSIVNRQSQQGVALVITLILLSVTLVMAIAFLAISRRERGSVTTSTDTITARLAADDALAKASAQIIATIYATTNPFVSGLVVSTNYQNVFGYVPNISNPTNVNYDFLDSANGGGPLTTTDQRNQNIANLLYLPRAPVYVTTNRQTGESEFRFYLDLNRNAHFEGNALSPVISPDPANPYYNLNGGTMPSISNGNTLSNSLVGDPEWIGVLERPDVPHGPNNKFVSRYAFVAMPADSTLDLNAIHNQVLNENLSSNDGYFRNQGVGSWEINLAAFLADLNTNQWDNPLTAGPYVYNESSVPRNANTGYAFEDARSLLSYRYNYNYNSLPFASSVLAANSYAGPVDLFPLGLVMTNVGTPVYSFNLNNGRWAGGDNTNHFFSISSDLFDPAKSSLNFTNHLQLAGNGVSTYDRYTAYRLLSQLGTDSSPESDKMNLNYDNLDFYGKVIPGWETNLIPWTPIRFFNNAADRMLRMYSARWFSANPSNYLATYYGIGGYYYTHPDGLGNTITNDPTGFGLTNVPYFGITNQIPSFGIGNIPVLMNSNFVYTSAIQRILQLAANMYDASTNRTYDASLFSLPTLFKPLLSRVDNAPFGYNVIITNFVEYNGLNNNFGNGTAQDLTNVLNSPLDLKDPIELDSAVNWQTRAPLVYGVPIIVGAKKGLPNFNAFALQSTFQVTRKLQLTRQSTNDPVTDYKLNQMFNCSVTNQLAIEFWNSYATNYTRPTTIWVADKIQMVITNDITSPSGPLWYPLNTYLYASTTMNNWSGIGLSAATSPQSIATPGSFLINNLNAILLPPATYAIGLLPNGYHFNPIGTNDIGFQSTGNNGSDLYPQPRWGLLSTNNLQVVMIDNQTGRAIDYVQLRGPNKARDLTAEILTLSNLVNPSAMWLTNYVESGPLERREVPAGVEAQLLTSDTYVSDGTAHPLWGNQGTKNINAQIDGFRAFLHNPPANYTNAYGVTNLAIQAAYTPTATTSQVTDWQVNDPLVHYLASDLFVAANDNAAQSTPQNTLITRTLNDRYQPWGLNKHMAGRPNVDASPYNSSFKDPLVWGSDYWNFPTNQYPTVGWLGRVHRGTPWQTVYLKATNIVSVANGLNTWMNWTGNRNGQDSVNADPVQDRMLFDIFTTALNDNATRGQLSVNAGANNTPSLAAWSAVFSGVMALSNNVNDLTAKNFRILNPFKTAPSVATPINPAGPKSASSLLGQLVNGINSTRSAFTNAYSAVGSYKHVGDILSVPQLSQESPFLNRSGTQPTNGISEAMYEWLPQQTLSLLRVTSEPRYVIYSYGQTLKPAPNSVVTGGGTAYFGMVTNYQVVAETATRAVVRLTPVVTTGAYGFQTNYTLKIEQFNVLPPE